MKSATTSSTLAMAVLAAIAGSATAADDSGWYLGLNAGQARAKIDDAQITSSLLGAGFTTTSIRDDNDHFGYRAFVGYDFNRYFAMEGGYFDPGRFGYYASTAPAGMLSGNMRLNGLNLDALAFLPFTDNFSAFGRVGVNYTKVRDSFVGTGAVNVLTPDSDKTAANYKFGLGLQYSFSRSFAMRLEAERNRISDPVGPKADIELYSVGLIYKIGRHADMPLAAPPPPPPPPRAVMPPPVAAAPPPPPPAPPADDDRDGVLNPSDRCPNTPAGERVDANGCSLRANLKVFFDYDSSVIKAESYPELDALVKFLADVPNSAGAVEGHTDSMGSDAYNLALSRRRADSVRRYLMDKGVAGNRITAQGFGESQPDGDNRTADGRSLNRRVVFQRTDVR
jgi:OOP family OmpA-OmpF porin